MEWLQELSKTKLLSAFRYVYLLSFFLLLSGVFSPIITGRSYQDVFFGTMVLFIGLLGAIFTYNSATKNNFKYLLVGMTLMTLSLATIILLSWSDKS